MSEQHWDQTIRNAIHQAPDELPSVVREKLEATYRQLPQSTRYSRVGKPALWICASLVILLAGAFALGFISPAMAQVLRQLPGIGLAFHTVGDAGVQKVMEDGLATSVGQTVEDKGVAVTLDQVVYDGTRISIGLLHERNLSINLTPSDSIRVDGRFLNTGIGGASKDLPDGRSASVFTFSLDEPLPDQFKFEFHFQEVTVMREGKPRTIDGNWWFETPVSKIKEGVREKKFDPPIIREFDGIRIAVTGVTLTPLTTQIAFDLVKPDRYDPFTTAKDNVSIGDIVIQSDLDFQLLDPKGMILEPLGGSGHGMPDEPEHNDRRFAPISLDNDELLLRIVNRQSKMTKVSDNSFIGAEQPVIKYYALPDNYPYTVSQGEAGNITFINMTFEDGQTWVEYEVQGYEPYTQDSAWWLEDDRGEKYRFDRYDQSRLQDDAYVYKVKLPTISQQSNLKIAIVEIKPQKFIDELELVIPLE